MNINYNTIETVLAKIDAAYESSIFDYDPCDDVETRIINALNDYNNFVDIAECLNEYNVSSNYIDHLQRCIYVSLFDDKLDFSFAIDESIKTALNNRIDEIILNRPMFIQLCLMTYDEIAISYPDWHII